MAKWCYLAKDFALLMIDMELSDNLHLQPDHMHTMTGPSGNRPAAWIKILKLYPKPSGGPSRRSISGVK